MTFRLTLPVRRSGTPAYTLAQPLRRNGIPPYITPYAGVVLRRTLWLN
ncbi:MAG TPA: hypothetical protein VIO61_01790 [Anaerolineaceae bacterium]